MDKTRDMDAKEKLISLLRSIGLNQYEASAYACLLLFGEATAGELSNRANIPRPRVYDIINRLQKKGFVVVQPGRPVRYRAVPPEEAIDAYIKLKEEEFKQEVDRIRKLAHEISRWGAGRRSIEQPRGFWLLNTDTLLRSRMESLISSSSKEVVVTLTPEFLAEYGNTLIPLLEDAAARGIRVRVIAPKNRIGSFAFEGDVEIVETDQELPPAIFVDGKRSILAVPGGKQAILVEHPEFSRSLKQIIESHAELF